MAGIRVGNGKIRLSLLSQRLLLVGVGEMVTINLHCKIPLSVVHFQTLLVLLDRCLLQQLQKYPSALVRLKPINLWAHNSLLTVKPSLSHEPLYYSEVHHHAFAMLKAHRTRSKDCC